MTNYQRQTESHVFRAVLFSCLLHIETNRNYCCCALFTAKERPQHLFTICNKTCYVEKASTPHEFEADFFYYPSTPWWWLITPHAIFQHGKDLRHPSIWRQSLLVVCAMLKRVSKWRNPRSYLFSLVGTKRATLPRFWLHVCVCSFVIVYKYAVWRAVGKF